MTADKEPLLNKNGEIRKVKKKETKNPCLNCKGYGILGNFRENTIEDCEICGGSGVKP